MYKRIKAVDRQITVAEAERFLAINTFDGQRSLKPEKARRYSDMMKSGEFRPGDVDIAETPDGKKVMMNGQHFCHAIIANGAPYQGRVTHWSCSEPSDLWRLFATFDVHATRTEAQIIKGARGLYEAEILRELPLRHLSLAASGLFVLGEGNTPRFHSTPESKSTKARLLGENPDAAQWVDNVLGTVANDDTQKLRLLHRVGVVAAMLATWKIAPTEATHFWYRVGGGHNLGSGTAMKGLHDSLFKASPVLECKGGSQRLRNWYVLCVAWWNAWVTGETRKGVKLSLIKDTPKPLRPRRQP